MLQLLIAHLAAALAAPALVRWLGRRAFLLLAAVPAASAVWALTETGSVLDGAESIIRIPWVAALDLDLVFRVDALSWLLVLMVGGIGSGVLIYSSRYFSSRSTDLGRFAAVDKEAFTQIIGNLLTNALKYAERTIEIVMRTESPTGTVTILVKNDGYLIPLSMREKIFETFTRLKMTDNQQGSGLGLALARSLAQLHKGHLRLASPENGMNVFLLTLPLKQRPHKRYHGTKIAKD